MKIELKDGLLFFYENWMEAGLADKMFAFLKKAVPWKQEKGKYAPFPRLTCFYSDTKYVYSGVTHEPRQWLDSLQTLKEKISEVAKINFNSLLLNYYRDGKDSIGWHSDAEPELGPNPVIASLSFGETRTFCMKHKKEGTFELRLPHGSLLIMDGATQHHWLHSVPKENTDKDRMNLTFRKINVEPEVMF